MLSTRAELEAELVSQLQVASNSSQFPSARITSLIQNAYIKATELFRWNDLVKAKCTSSVASGEWYDYPSDFRSGTIIRLEMDSEPYERKNWEDYLEYKHENPTSTKKIFSSFGRQFFIFPTPATSGTNNIYVWGSIQAAALSLSTSETIFSNNKENCNMAVVGLALAMALKLSKPDISLAEEKNALVVLQNQFQTEQASTQRDQRIDKALFNVSDYFVGRSGRSPYRRFSYTPEEW